MELGTSAARGRPKVGILSVPWTSVPPGKLGSIASIVHEVTLQLCDRFEFHVAAGTWQRDASRESALVHYHPLADRLDRWWGDPLQALQLLLRRERVHAFHRPGFRRHYVRAAARRFAQEDCSTVLCMVGAQWLPVLRSMLPHVRLVVWFQDATAADLPSTAKFVSCADQVLGCSRFVAERMAHGRPAAAVYNAFDPAVFRVDPAIDRDPTTLLYVGRITPEKGVHVLVDAFRQLSEQHPRLRLQLAGPIWISDASLLRGSDPAHRAELEALCASDYGAELRRRAGPAVDRLQFLGTLDRDALREAYNRATVFVHPALWEEPFGMTVVEAMACGAPVVVTRRGGVPEFVEEGQTGCVVASGDSAALANALHALLVDPKLRQLLGTNGARIAPQRWTWADTARALSPHLSG